MTRAYNFNAGPAALPLPVLQQAQEELLDFRQSGMSVMELSHRSKEYEAVHNEAQDLIKGLLGIPNNYHILFLQGGASLQFAMVPFNFLPQGKAAGYVLTGSWSEKALKEAQLLGETKILVSSKENHYRHIPTPGEWDKEITGSNHHLSYTHITSNNTIFGTQWNNFPELADVPLIADMSSDILSRPFKVSKFGLIYAGAQKNLGPSGVTLVIIRNDLLEKAPDTLPAMLKYDTYIKNNSLYNTPPTFAIYMLGLVAKWVKQNGGLNEIAKHNEKKAGLIYEVIDQSNGFYQGHAEPHSRSLMNITFRLRNDELEKKFLAEASEAGFVGLKGHRSVGGCRASTYNAVPLEACQALAELMKEFYQKEA